MKECSSLALRKLQLGTIAFNNYITSMVQDLIMDNSQKRFGNTNKQAIWNYGLSVEYLVQAYG
jgi:hypothetical protein